MPTLARPPAAPSILDGFLNLEGAAVAVVRLDVLFGFSRQSLEAYTPLIVLRQVEVPIALMVQRVIGIRSVPSNSVLALQDNDCFNGCIEANIQLDAGVAHVVSVRHLLLERERTTIADFQTLEAMRVHNLEVPQA
jgi:chemotaxis signal transduction protein